MIAEGYFNGVVDEEFVVQLDTKNEMIKKTVKEGTD